MSLFFILKVFLFFISVFLIDCWINNFLIRNSLFERKYLPCLAWGWFIYLIAYLAGRWISAPVEVVRGLYTSMTIMIPALAGMRWLITRNFYPSLWWWRPKNMPLDRWTLVLVVVFIGGMIFVGPYLEFPSDPVEHLYRIQAWEKVRWMNYDGYPQAYSRFVYFFEHWLLQDSNLSLGIRSGLTLLSAILQGILLWQFIRLTQLISNNTVLSWFGGGLSLGYFGYSAISFYRYTALSGALLAFTVCLEGFILIIAAFSKEELRYLFLLPPLLIFCWYNHEQETLLQLNAIIGLCFVLLIFRYRDFSFKFRQIMGAVALLMLVGSGLVFWKVDIIPANESPVYQARFLNSIFNLSGWEIYYHRFAILNEMMGILGWLSTIGALLVLCLNRSSRKVDIMAGLCVWPVIVLGNPLSVYFLMRFIPLEVFHRLIYGSLYWIFPVVFIQNWSKKLGKASLVRRFSQVIRFNRNIFSTRKLILYALVTFLTLLSWIPSFPIKGKMSSVWLKLDPRLDGSNLQPTIEYLREQASKNCVDPSPDPALLPIRSYILSDTYVNTYLLATGYFYTVTNRHESVGSESPPLALSVSATEDSDYSTFIEKIKTNQICYIVIYLQTQKLYSFMGDLVGHWGIEHAKTQRYYSAKFIQWVTENPHDFKLVFEDGQARVFKVL